MAKNQLKIYKTALCNLMDNKCAMCGSGDNLHLHHINHDWENNTVENRDKNLQSVYMRCDGIIYSKCNVTTIEIRTFKGD